TLGADQVIDYTHGDFTQHGDRYDLIFDLVGNRSLKELVSVLTPKGVLVMSSGGGSRWFGPLGRSMGFMVRSPLIKPKISWYMASPQAGNLVTLAELIESGAVRPAVECVYPLSEVPEAVRHFEERHARAKIAIAVGQPPRAEARGFHAWTRWWRCRTVSPVRVRVVRLRLWLSPSV